MSLPALMPSESALRERAHDGAWLPFWMDLSSWPLSPQESVRSLLGRPYPFLLESASGPKKTGRFSVVGSDPYLVFWSKGRRAHILSDSGERVLDPCDPFEVLRSLLRERPMTRMPGSEGFLGGAVGFFGYDVKNLIEELPDTVADDLDMPEMFWVFVDSALIFDRAQGRVRGVAQSRYDGNLSACRAEAQDRIERLLARFKDPLPRTESRFQFGTIRSNHTMESYRHMVERARTYIAAGDIFQANLSQRLSTPFEGDPFRLYQILTQINPSPFAFFFGFPEFQLVSCSPERLISLNHRHVQTRPIAGTRPRGRDQEEDEALSRELILHPKERAEHIMIVDMARNDIGRVCDYGTVLPDELMVLEPYSHVIHIVTNIVGTLKEDKDGVDLVKATFPGASITGVPKVRCMEIIDELEEVRRGPYTGSAGWISSSGDLDLNIIIRTLLIRKGLASLHVGGGIVWDSEPEHEYQETLHKGQALLSALDRAQQEGGDPR